MDNYVLLSPSHCLFSPHNAPMTTGQREQKREMKGWGRLVGGEGRVVGMLKETCRSLSRRIQPSTPSSKWDPQQGLLCLYGLFIYSCSPCGKQPPPPPPPLPPPCLGSSLRIAALKDLLPHDREVWMYLTAHVSVFLCMFNYLINSCTLCSWPPGNVVTTNWSESERFAVIFPQNIVNTAPNALIIQH